ncbi:MAG: MTH1187 family thiamine-binding protein [Thermoplasmatota archaeon]
MIAEFSVVPLDKGESVSEYVSEMLDIIDKSGVDYRFTPMATVVEGDWDEVMDLISRCHHEMRKKSKRVVTDIKIDDREGAKNRISGKIESVEKKVGRDLNK